jgi:murein DD-endopeptidase MepM/ murein hydrolase activator NlpD
LPASLVALRDTPAVPGGIAWISLHSQSDTPPNITYQQQRVVVLRDEQRWVALVGIPLSAKLGQHAVIDQQTGESYQFQVKEKKYKIQRLKVKKRKVDLQRIQQERELIKAALATPWRATSTSPLPLMQPVKGRFSSSFGLRRYFNGQRRNPHTGLDIAAPQGTPVAAPAAGKVVNTGHYFFTGETVLIDHGQGVVTLYAHLDTVAVSPGDIVEKRQIIGKVGKTGRVTGPHLHWSVSLNQTMIDPKLVMQ